MTPIPTPTHDLGACPVCGDLVPRTLQVLEGRATETYKCALHGPLSYGHASVPLRAWADLASGPRSMLTPHEV